MNQIVGFRQTVNCMKNGKYFLSLIGLIGLSVFATAGFINWSPEPNDSRLQSAINSGELIVLTRNAPTTYFIGRDTPIGFEHDLVRTFAQSLSLKPRFIVKDSVADILMALKKGEGILAAAGLTATNARADEYLFGPHYQEVTQQVVCRRGDQRPRNVEDLSQVDLWVSASTSYTEQLNKLKFDYPDLQWRETQELDTEQLLELVYRNEIGCTIADSNIVAINRRYFPELSIAFDISYPNSLAWILPKDAHELQGRLTNWFWKIKQDGQLKEIHDRYYSHAEIFDYVDIKRFQSRINSRLPQYKDYFQQAADKYEIPWTLIAAQSYQESHWRRKAKSPTGVRGMMMLTLTTAKELGIKSRLDARESIHGGAQYLVKLKQRLPEEIVEPDRTWIALAAYNVGMGHIYDARTLSRQLGKDPDKWTDLSEVLPLLSQKKYYKKLKYGYARGHEPVAYVTRIRNFRDVLENSQLDNSSTQFADL